MPSMNRLPCLQARCARLLACAIAALLFGVFALPLRAANAAPPDTIAERALACAACHGKEGRATRDGYFPRIAGKPAGYLYNQLLNFRDGRRQYPQMTYVIEHLSDAYLQELSVYFSELNLPYPAPQKPAVPDATLARGQRLATQGDPQRGVPACIACHGARLTGAQPAIPGLLGLSRHYLNAQFGAWRSGVRQAAAPDCMATITRKLSADDINAIVHWVAAQPVESDMRPLATAPAKLPLRCGSVVP